MEEEKRDLTGTEKVILKKLVQTGNFERAKDLIDLMKDIDQIIDRGDSVLSIACQSDQIQIVKYVVELGADVNKTNAVGMAPLLVSRKIEITEFLLNAGAELNVTTKDGSSALSIASSNGRFEIVKLLIDSGIDIKQYGGRALFRSSYQSNLEICQLLIDSGAEVNYIMKSEDDKTPLHYACHYNRIENVEFLLNNGADETIKDKNGETPIEYAKSEEIKEFIKNYNSTKFVLK